jgi:HAD superfamily hydrolase (TIGR01450 family)
VTGPLVDGSNRPLAGRHDVALLDLDGVLYVGPDAVTGAPEAVAAAARAGLRPAFVTNNASRTPGTVAGHLTELGIPATEDAVVTSAQAAATLVAATVPSGAAVLVVGGEGLRAALVERGLRPITSADGAAAVVQGFAPEVAWTLLAEGTYAVRAGLPWVASNLDATVPTPRGIAPGNGALVDLVARVTGRRPDAVAGKPETPLHEEAVRRTGARDPLVVGDRLDTDIEGAVRAGVPSLLVMTGVARPVDLLRATDQCRPTYVARGLADGLLEPHPAVRSQPDGGWTCGGWTSRREADDLELTGDGDALDGLRVAAVAAWAGEPLPGPVLERIAARLQL